MTPVAVDEELLAARDAYERRAWGDAYEGLTAADARTPLAAADLERLAIAAYLLGRPDEFIAAAARAHLEAVRAGDTGLALRAAYGLGMALIQRGDMAQGSGWLARAEPPRRGDRL